jgi:hypothetical protein
VNGRENEKFKMNRSVIALLIFIAAVACNRKPFVDYKLKFETISDNCENLKPSFRMISNIVGERYEFDKCLSTAFTKDMMHMSRQGDTVFVQFTKPLNKTSLYKITLDIDSYPRYHFITVDDETFPLTSSQD